MRIRPWATLTTDLPDDHIEDDHDIIQYGGKSVVKAIGEILVRLGCEVEEPVYADEHGWEIYITVKKRRLWCQVTLIDKFLILLKQNSWVANAFHPRHPVYIEILSRLALELDADPRFHEVSWFTGAEVDTAFPGTEHPVEI